MNSVAEWGLESGLWLRTAPRRTRRQWRQLRRCPASHDFSLRHRETTTNVGMILLEKGRALALLLLPLFALAQLRILQQRFNPFGLFFLSTEHANLRAIN